MQKPIKKLKDYLDQEISSQSFIEYSQLIELQAYRIITRTGFSHMA